MRSVDLQYDNYHLSLFLLLSVYDPHNSSRSSFNPTWSSINHQLHDPNPKRNWHCPFLSDEDRVKWKCRNRPRQSRS